MEKELIIAKFRTIDDVKADKRILYEVMELLGLQFKKTRCVRCLRDYYNIVREELGLIEDAAEVSSFNGKYTYILNRPVMWNGYRMDNSTDPAVISEFVKKHRGYYIINNDETE